MDDELKEDDPNMHDYGHFENRNFQDDDRRNFLNGSKSHVLCFWHVCEQFSILHNTLNVLPSSMSASSTKVATATEPAKKKPKIDDDAFRSALMQSLVSSASASMLSSLAEQQKVCVDYLTKASELEDGELKSARAEFAKKTKAIADSLTEKLGTINS